VLIQTDPTQIRLDAPGALWLLAFPALLLFGWTRLFICRRREARAFRERRQVPVEDRVPFFGDLLLWFFLIGAMASLIVALARPQALLERVRQAGIDLVILMDASASMYVQDVPGNRWQRSARFVAVLGDALQWKDDRIALAVFANLAAPQVRLTKDPNTYFFFLEHLSARPPFRLEDDQTWDTNLELGIEWGLRLISKDEELNGRSLNAPIMVLVSDGQAWSGEVQVALDSARAHRIPVHVVGVGTTFGGVIPEPSAESTSVVHDGHEHTMRAQAPVRSALNRTSLRTIAVAGGGQYFELDRQGDREISHSIIDDARRRSGSQQMEERWEDLYWRFIALATVLAVLGILALRTAPEFLMSSLVATATLLGIGYVLW
jgi:Ca-activated chloride channel homolog